MNFQVKIPNSSPDAGGRSSTSRPVVVIDVAKALLVEANPAAIAALALDPRVAFPIQLDAAMPAVQELRKLPSSRRPSSEMVLIFWTPRGTHSWLCRVTKIAGKDNPRLRVQLHIEPAAESPLEPGLSTEAVASLAHELRAPIAAIFSAADVMTSGYLGTIGDDRFEGYIVGIRNTAHHLLGVVETMLQDGAGSIVGEAGRPVAMDVTATVLEVARGLQALADRAGITLALDLASEMPAVVADMTGLRQMVFNLLSNGIRHAGGGATVTARTGCGAAGIVWLEVEDDGPGIPEAVIERTLDLAPATDSRPTGDAAASRLGLLLTRKLAEANSAVLTLYSDAAGTRARVTFGARAANTV